MHHSNQVWTVFGRCSSLATGWSVIGFSPRAPPAFISRGEHRATSLDRCVTQAWTAETPITVAWLTVSPDADGTPPSAGRKPRAGTPASALVRNGAVIAEK